MAASEVPEVEVRAHVPEWVREGVERKLRRHSGDRAMDSRVDGEGGDVAAAGG